MTGARRTGAGRRGPAGPGDGARQKNAGLENVNESKKHAALKVTA